MEIGKVIKDFRISQNLSLREFAKKCDISYSNLSNIENGKIKPNNLTLNKIATTFDIKFGKNKYGDNIIINLCKNFIDEEINLFCNLINHVNENYCNDVDLENVNKKELYEDTRDLVIDLIKNRIKFYSNK
ncbi:TPA: helix-turn-helix domain-containing protein [Clostridium perfringens]|nr:helix-turn-helix transcriptional regulator [Clostridium perfringens]DAL56386.1 MAG TPA_asm: Helix-turn-helix XRE-family like protein [Caudoviricetes sp.]